VRGVSQAVDVGVELVLHVRLPEIEDVDPGSRAVGVKHLRTEQAKLPDP